MPPCKNAWLSFATLGLVATLGLFSAAKFAPFFSHTKSQATNLANALQPYSDRKKGVATLADLMPAWGARELRRHNGGVHCLSLQDH